MESQEFDLYRRTTEVYMTKGIKNMTMDDMAKELKVSKKTLYKYVRNRPELVSKSMKWRLDFDTKVLTAILERNLGAVEELWELSSYHIGHLKMMHPSLHHDLAKYYREAWLMFSDFTKTGYLYQTTINNIKKGISQGLYRNDFDAEVIAKLYLSKIDMVFDSSVFPATNYNFGEVCREMVKYHVNGMATEKGRAEIAKFWSNNKSEPGFSKANQQIVENLLSI